MEAATTMHTNSGPSSLKDDCSKTSDDSADPLVVTVPIVKWSNPGLCFLARKILYFNVLEITSYVHIGRGSPLELLVVVLSLVLFKAIVEARTLDKPVTHSEVVESRRPRAYAAEDTTPMWIGRYLDRTAS